jgi:hypothetical protein
MVVTKTGEYRMADMTDLKYGCSSEISHGQVLNDLVPAKDRMGIMQLVTIRTTYCGNND